MKRLKNISLDIPKDIYSHICGYLRFKGENYKSLELVCRSAYEGSLQYSNNKTSKWNLHYLSLQEKRKVLYCVQNVKSTKIMNKFRSIIKIEKCEDDLNTLVFALNHFLFEDEEIEELNVWNNMNNRKDVLFLVKRSFFSFRFAKQFHDDREVVLEAMKHKHGFNGVVPAGMADFEYVSERLRNDREIVLEAVKRDCYAIEHANKRFMDEKEIVFICIKKKGYLLKYASERLKNDKEIVLEAVKDCGYSLCYASERLKDDREVVLEAVRNDGESFDQISERLQD